MNRFLFMLTVVLLAPSFISCKPTNRRPKTATSRSFAQLALGDYLSTDYINELTKTRSPLRAGSSGGVELVSLRRNGEQFVLQPVINFHEGDSDITVTQDGSPVSRAPEPPNVSVSMLDEHTIRFGYDSFRPANYAFVNDSAAYVARFVLVGQYKDERGRDYEFQENGWAVFPDRKFQFEVGLDHVLDNFDYFMDAGLDRKRLPWRVWAFKWNGNRLEIFRTKSRGGPDEIEGAAPAILLSRIR